MMRRANILIFSLMIMGVVTLVTQQLVKSVTVGVAFSHAMVDREQAEMLALGGLRIAVAQLARSLQPEKIKDQQQEKKLDMPEFSFKNFIEQVLPHLERWQSFELTKDIDGCDGRIQISMSAEEGKLAINQLFDEPQRVITNEAKALLKPFSIKKKVPVNALPTQLAGFFKKRTNRVTDISELGTMTESIHLPLYYEPPVPRTAKRGEEEPPRDIALQNLFTTWNREKVINPLVMSDAMCAILRVRRPQADDATRRADRYKRLAENYNQLKNAKGDEMWKAFQILFETKPRLPKEVMDFFSPVVEPRFFSVVSCGKVGEVSQKVLAIIERTDPKPSAQKQNQQSRGAEKQSIDPKSLFHIRRLCWL